MHSGNDLKELFLFHEMKKGNEHAFDFFFRYYYSGLCVFAQKKHGLSEEDAKSIVQDVFVKFWNNRDALDIKHSVRSYLFTSVKNKCLDFLKKEGRGAFAMPPDFQTTTGDEPYEQYVLAELQALFMESLQKLPERCRLIFELSYFDQKKNAEIAAHLGISVKTVENQKVKALHVLRHELREYLPLLLLFDYFDFFRCF